MLVMRGSNTRIRSGPVVKTAADQTLERSITTKPATIQPPPLPAINGVAGSGFQSPGSRILNKTSRSGWDVDGVEIRVILDFGAGFIDHRGWFMNAGA